MHQLDRTPRTEEEFLELQDALAHERLKLAARSLGEDVLSALELRGRVERHPFASVGASAVGGMLLARPLLRLLRAAGHRRGGWVRSGMNLALRFGGLGFLSEFLTPPAKPPSASHVLHDGLLNQVMRR